MSTQSDVPLSRVPTLAQYCYRFINSHLDSIQSLGGIPYPLIEPILRSCSATQLLVLEKNSPHLIYEDQDVWRSLCFRDFPRSQQRYENRDFTEPESWREEYFVCRASEERRLEEVGSRIKSKRQEVEEEKRERSVVYTDRVPPAKRSRFNSGPSKPKTLFEKTKAESIKIQRSVYGAAMLPPMIVSNTAKTRVTPLKFNRSMSTGTVGRATKPRPGSQSTSAVVVKSTPPTSPVKAPEVSSGAGGRTPSKKDPMATLFIPKHKAHSQLPSGPPLSLRRGT